MVAVSLKKKNVPALTVPEVKVAAVTSVALSVPVVVLPKVELPALIVVAVSVPTVVLPAVSVPVMLVSPADKVPTVVLPAVKVPPIAALPVPVMLVAFNVPVLTVAEVSVPTVVLPAVKVPPIAALPVPVILVAFNVPVLTVAEVSVPAVVLPKVVLPALKVPALTRPLAERLPLVEPQTTPPIISFVLDGPGVAQPPGAAVEALPAPSIITCACAPPPPVNKAIAIAKGAKLAVMPPTLIMRPPFKLMFR